jgi:hypothetical protein
VSDFASHETFFVVFWGSVSFQFLVIEILGRHRSSGLDAFLMLWKDADPDIPILKQAKAETVKLQQPTFARRNLRNVNWRFAAELSSENA